MVNSLVNRKEYFVFLIVFLAAFALTAQDTLWIGHTPFEISIKDNQISFNTKTQQTRALYTTIDTIITFNPETYLDLIQMKTHDQPASYKSVQKINKKINRVSFLKTPLLRISHKGQNYLLYKFFVHYTAPRAISTIGIDDSYQVNRIKIYPLYYYKQTTLLDLKALLSSHDKGEKEIILENLAFYSHSSKTHLYLKEAFLIEYK